MFIRHLGSHKSVPFVFYDNDIVKVTDFFIQKNMPVDAIIFPQQELANLLRIYPGFEIRDLAAGR